MPIGWTWKKKRMYIIFDKFWTVISPFSHTLARTLFGRKNSSLIQHARERAYCRWRTSAALVVVKEVVVVVVSNRWDGCRRHRREYIIFCYENYNFNSMKNKNQQIECVLLIQSSTLRPDSNASAVNFLPYTLYWVKLW